MRPPIIFNETNKPKIEAWLDEVQNRSRERKISMKEIAQMLSEVSDYLDIPKKHLEGTFFDCDYRAQEFPKAYSKKSWSAPQSTHVQAAFNNGKWKILDIYRGDCGKTRYKIILSDSAKEALIKRFSTK